VIRERVGPEDSVYRISVVDPAAQEVMPVGADFLVADAVPPNPSASLRHLLSREKQGEMQILPVPPPSKRQNLM